MVQSTLRYSNVSELAGISTIEDSRTFSGRLEFLATYGISEAFQCWVDGSSTILSARLKVLEYLLRLKRSSIHGTKLKWKSLLEKHPYLYEKVLRKQEGDPIFDYPATDRISLEKLPLPTLKNKFPKCPGFTAKDNRLSHIFAHRLQFGLGFEVQLENYHGEYWVSSQVAELMEPKFLFINYLTSLALSKYSAYDLILKRYDKFCAKILDISDNEFADIPKPRYSHPAPIIRAAYEGSLDQLQARGRIDVVVERGYLKKELCFLVKLTKSFRLYWLTGKQAVLLGRQALLEHIVQVRRKIGRGAWNKVLRGGADFIVEEVLRKRPRDIDVGLTDYHIGMDRDLDEPNFSNNYLPGCPGPSLEDNILESVLNHVLTASQLRFYVTFFDYHDGYWIHSIAVKQMNHGPTIRYLVSLSEKERERIFCFDRDFEFIYHREDIPILP